MNNVKDSINRVIAGKFMPVILALVMITSFGAPVLVHADQFDDQINALRAQNNSNQASANQLQTQVDGYQGAIDALQSQINALQDSINTNTAKQADLQSKIVAAEAELAHQKKILGDNIRQMYLEGQISTLEMLASSKDLSDFVDKQQYRNSVQAKIQDTLNKITELKHQLNAQKDEVEKLLKDQETMKATLASQQGQQNSLLAFTQAQKDQYTSAIKTNNSQISALKAQQLAANARFIGGAGNGPACGGGYPAKWCEIPQDSVIDNWGMYNRECVSYAAFRVAASNRFMPYWGGVGNANQWDEDARADGILVDGTPRAGDVAISNNGAYGHAMYVESVNGDGTINISQYNAALNGRYSTRNDLAVGNLVFIHF
ncbi:MAG: CHAP domain-containing protein [Candidatus Saccharibacteria bacterium]